MLKKKVVNRIWKTIERILVRNGLKIVTIKPPKSYKYSDLLNGLKIINAFGLSKKLNIKVAHAYQLKNIFFWKVKFNNSSIVVQLANIKREIEKSRYPYLLPAFEKLATYIIKNLIPEK